MSLISNLIAQNQAVAARFSGNSAVFAGRDNLLRGANTSDPGSTLKLKTLERDEVSFTSQIHQGNFNAKYAAKWEESAREKMKKDIKSAFSTFA